jgi:hypothetical protein
LDSRPSLPLSHFVLTAPMITDCSLLWSKFPAFTDRARTFLDSTQNERCFPFVSSQMRLESGYQCEARFDLILIHTVFNPYRSLISYREMPNLFLA